MANPNVHKVMEEGLQHYRVAADTGLLEVKQTTHETILDMKQRGALWKDWLLFSTDSTAQLTLVNWKTGDWLQNPSSDDVSNIPISQLRKSLLDFYGNEIK